MNQIIPSLGKKTNKRKSLPRVDTYFERIAQDEYNKLHKGINFYPFYSTLLSLQSLRRKFTYPNLTILDIGAGKCDLENILAKNISLNRINKVIALDRCPKILSQAKVIENKLPFPIEFRVADAENTNLPKDFSDITFALNVIPYITNLPSFSQEMFRITNRLGLLILLAPKKSPFWQKSFESVTVIFHNNIEKTVMKSGFKTLERKNITILPIPNVKNITLDIAQIFVFEVLK
jgi:ubiquinone/menaquinone biosynthesis C-methylase UbiE